MLLLSGLGQRETGLTQVYKEQTPVTALPALWRARHAAPARAAHSPPLAPPRPPRCRHVSRNGDVTSRRHGGGQRAGEEELVAGVMREERKEPNAEVVAAPGEQAEAVTAKSETGTLRRGEGKAGVGRRASAF